VDFTYVVETARLAAVSGARQFLLVSAVGPTGPSSIFYSRVKGETEEAVRKLPLAESRSSGRRSSRGSGRESRPFERWGSRRSPAVSFAMVGPLRRYRPVAADDVARAMLEVARREIPGVNVYDSDRIEEIARTGAVP